MELGPTHDRSLALLLAGNRANISYRYRVDAVESIGMPVPDRNAPCWVRLVNGGFARLRTNHLGAKMLAKRIERSPDSPAAKAFEIYSFFVKWEPSLREELAQLSFI